MKASFRNSSRASLSLRKGLEKATCSVSVKGNEDERVSTLPSSCELEQRFAHRGFTHKIVLRSGRPWVQLIMDSR